MANPLDAVMRWYRTAWDSLRVTQRVLEKQIPNAVLDKYVFSQLDPADGLSQLDAAKDELKRLVVLALTAVFERTLRDYLAAIPQTALSPGDPHRKAICKEILKGMEFWNLSSQVLEVFPAVAGAVRGQVKQVIDFRNWVAHGHTLAAPTPAKLVPEKAYAHLSAFLVQAGVVGP